ncbi:hypothetical protein H8D79_00200 [PVC group bacterium]|nr:hypothetical protein [PVC group bacterium]
MNSDAAKPSGPLEKSLRAAVEVFERRGVSYALMGGLALAQHGVVRATQDVDLLLTVSQIQLGTVLDDLRSAGFVFDLRETIREWQQDHMTQLEYRGIRVDWLAPVLPAFQHVLMTAVRCQMAGTTVRVASADGLVLLKLIAFREQDKVDAKGLLGANAGRLDLDTVREKLRDLFEEDDPRWRWLDRAVSDLAP